MPRRNFQQRPNFRQIARDLNISATTLYRVLNRKDNVKETTRRRILEVLNEKGVFLYSAKKTTVIFDSGDNDYLDYFLPPLLERLSKDFNCVFTNSTHDRENFLNAVSTAEVVLFTGDR